MGKVKKPVEPSCLYPKEDEIARLLLGDRAKHWPEIAQLEENHGFPRIDPLYGGRYWPAVLAFYERRLNLIPQKPESLASTDDHEGETFHEVRARRARSKAAQAKNRQD